jgi:hypothetical protein
MGHDMPTQSADKPPAHMVLYCLLRQKTQGEESARLLLIRKHGQPTFPPTKFRLGEDLYHALVRPMEEDLGLPPGSYFVEEELPMIPNAGESPRYPGLSKRWYLYPVVVSLTEEACKRLENSSQQLLWWRVDEIPLYAQEPNVLAIASYLPKYRHDLLAQVSRGPSMDAMASRWCAAQQGGVRVVKGADIRRILDAGSGAFELRAAAPYKPYQKQGLGFTWSFLTPKDTPDVHVHGLPAVEIYGVLEGRLQLWHKPMNQRGVRTWQCQTLQAGDWAEIEPLHCHLACWLTPQGLAAMVKSSTVGELPGIGKLGVSGKTTCDHCNVQRQCVIHPQMLELLSEYAKPFDQRDYARIAAIAEEAERE